MPDSDSHLLHGGLEFPDFTIDNYSLSLRDDNGFVGDNASRPAFQAILEAWRRLFEALHGKDPLGDKPTEEIPKKKLDVMMQREGAAAAAIHGALEDYAEQLARVVKRFLAHKSWKGVERIVIGGGLKQSDIGKLAVDAVAKRLFRDDVHVQLRLLHHHADEGGLIGWLHLMPPDLSERYRAMLAVDIGGTNIRCGIVRLPKDRDPLKAKVVVSDKWSHARDENTTRKEHVVQGIADMLTELIEYARKHRIKLAPWVGVACPGRIRQDGSISRGTQNLPGDWAHRDFHLPRALCKRLPKIDGQQTQVMLHNDAVVQGLSQLPYVDDVRRWGVLTVGTGVGNARYTMRRRRADTAPEANEPVKAPARPALRTASATRKAPPEAPVKPAKKAAKKTATKAVKKAVKKTAPKAVKKAATKAPKKAVKKAVKKVVKKPAARVNKTTRTSR
ncbi:ROK family protein [Bordetella genomosp. 8]|uniref:ROK family protein n=1 Tax=Bordetella genomosp. 8 TaxID=1416806 RepID=UPI000A327E41|nr:ROK family protein [Bordetella genomosp. 8]